MIAPFEIISTPRFITGSITLTMNVSLTLFTLELISVSIRTLMRVPMGSSYIERVGWANKVKELRKIKVETAKTLVLKMMDLTTASSIFADAQSTSAKLNGNSRATRGLLPKSSNLRVK
jgi:hypothetical protein